MLYFHLLFPPLMILSPLIVLWVYKPEEEADLALVAETRKRLLAWTGIALFAFLVLATLRLTLSSAEGHNALQGGVTQLMAFLFMPLWFLLAMPYMRAARPFMDQPPGPEPEVRSAQLVSRRNLRVLPRWAYWFPGLILATGLGLCIWQGLGSGEAKASMQILAASLLFLALLCVPLFPSLQSAALSTPEPMPTNPSKQLRDAYASLRRAKAWALWGLSVAIQFLLAGLALLFLTESFSAQDRSMFGLIGGIGGSLIGLFGGVFGSWVGFCGSRVHELRNREAAGKA